MEPLSIFNHTTIDLTEHGSISIKVKPPRSVVRTPESIKTRKTKLYADVTSRGYKARTATTDALVSSAITSRLIATLPLACGNLVECTTTRTWNPTCLQLGIDDCNSHQNQIARFFPKTFRESILDSVIITIWLVDFSILKVVYSIGGRNENHWFQTWFLRRFCQESGTDAARSNK